MSELRALPSIAGAISTRVEPGKPPKLEWLALKALRIDPSYQRDVTPRGQQTIIRIANEFRWSRFSPLIVAPVPGKAVYTVIDGQHRASAALLRGYDKVPCCVVEAGSQDQARIFSAVNGNVTPVTIFQLFRAARAAQEEWALAIDRVCSAAGLVPLVYPKAGKHIRPFETMALGTIRKNIIRFGENDIIAALTEAKLEPWAEMPGAWNSGTVESAIRKHREGRGAKPAPAEVNTVSIRQRIRDLKAKGHSRFAIQSALGIKLADIEAALGEA